MGHPILTLLILILAGLMLISLKSWTHRWIGFMLTSAGMNTVAGSSKNLMGPAFFAWMIMVSSLLLLYFFEDSKKK